MIQNIFINTAPDYYAKNLPVIPLYTQEKRPVPMDWSRFHNEPIPVVQQEEWLATLPDSNIGLVLGKQSNVVMMDIDTEDQALSSLIMKLLPHSPWHRIGKKGLMMAFRYSGQRTFRIRNTSGETICELLSERTQSVIPPSIHPDTLLAYKANCNLLDVIDDLPVLNDQIEAILRGALSEAGVNLSHSGWTKVTDFVSSGSRDVSMTEKAGLFAYAVSRGERTLKEAIGMLKSFHVDFIENVAGDEIDIDKHVSNLIKFLTRDVYDKGKALPEGWDSDLTSEEKKQLGLSFTEDDEEWNYLKLKEYLKDQFDRHPIDSQGRTNAVDQVLTRIARSTTLTKLDEDMLCQYITDVSGMSLRLTSLRARIKELKTGSMTGADHTEIARALIEELNLIYDLRVHNSGVWRWIGSHWEEYPEVEIMAKIANDYGHYSACKRASDHKGIFTVLKYLLPQNLKSTEIKGINFANGFLSEELKLLDHDPSYGMTYTMPFRYMPKESNNSKMFFKFLKDCWGKDKDYKDKIDAIQEAMCITLFGLGPRFQKVVLLQGAPNSGKSQLLRIASSLVPDRARCVVPPNDWSDRFMPAMMNEKLINVCGELSEKKKIDGQRFKDIVDGSEMSGQYKGKDIFLFRAICTHWFASNHYPKTEDTSEGFNRRWLILTFNKPISASERKLDIGDLIVAEERESIVAWAVKAMNRMKINNNYTLPTSHVQAIREIATMNNSIRFFIQESGKVRIGSLKSEKQSNLTSETRLYNAYWSFCIGPGGARPVGSRDFRAKMRELSSELGFSLKIEDGAFGGQTANYSNIILVEKEAA